MNYFKFDFRSLLMIRFSATLVNVVFPFYSYVYKLILKHNLLISKLIIKVKFLGIHIEINGKEKKHPSHEE